MMRKIRGKKARFLKKKEKNKKNIINVLGSGFWL